jgi:hypothetical protein
VKIICWDLLVVLMCFLPNSVIGVYGKYFIGEVPIPIRMNFSSISLTNLFILHQQMLISLSR